MIFATIAITVGGINPVISTFRARTSGPAAQESPRRLADVRGIVETISDDVFFVPPSSRVYMGDIRQLLSNETILIYATLINHFYSKMKSLIASIQGADGGEAHFFEATVGDLNGLCAAAAQALGAPVSGLQYFHVALNIWRDLEWDGSSNNAELRLRAKKLSSRSVPWLMIKECLNIFATRLRTCEPRRGRPVESVG